MSVTDNITLTLRKDAGRLGFLSPSRLNDVARVWSERIGIRSTSPRQQVVALSGGISRKSLARLLHGRGYPPARRHSGIDVASKAQLCEIIDRLAAGDPSRIPPGILMISSYLPELLGICDRIAIVQGGSAPSPQQCTEHADVKPPDRQAHHEILAAYHCTRSITGLVGIFLLFAVFGPGFSSSGNLETIAADRHRQVRRPRDDPHYHFRAASISL
jgi:hypothetical protein